jgi:invasion protein IalB
MEVLKKLGEYNIDDSQLTVVSFDQCQETECTCKRKEEVPHRNSGVGIGI